MLLNTALQMGTSHSANGMEFETMGTGLPAFTPAAVPPRSIRGRAKKSERPGRDAGGRWIACDEAAGVVEIHDPRLLRREQEAFCRALVTAAIDRFGAIRAAVYLETSTCRLEFGPGRFDAAEMSRRIASAVRAAIPAVRSVSAGRDESRPGSPAIGGGPAAAAVPRRATTADKLVPADRGEESLSRRRQLRHLALAGGSLTLTVAAIILPGLPTLPFLITTGRHAALASKRIERLLRRYPWCAAMLEEGETDSGLSIDWRSMAKWVGLVVVFAAVIWFLHPPLPVLLALEFGVMAFLAWRERCRSGDAAADLSFAV